MICALKRHGAYVALASSKSLMLCERTLEYFGLRGLFDKITAPVPGGDITWARASLATRRGTASIEWRLKPGGNIDVSVLVPPNTTAELVLPGNGPRELSAGRHSVTAALPAPAVHPLDAAREKLARRIERHVAGATAFAAGRRELAAASLPDASRVRRGEWVEK